MGKGFFDIYLKHQNTKTRRQIGQPTGARPADNFGRTLTDRLDNSPGQSSIKSESYEQFAFD